MITTVPPRRAARTTPKRLSRKRSGSMSHTAATVAAELSPPGLIERVLRGEWSKTMNGLIYLVGLIVVIMAILSFFGLR
jgi:hypothetical protein